MPIRFYIPLPGPFVWVPGRRHRVRRPGRSAAIDEVPTWFIALVLLVVVTAVTLLMIIVATSS